MRKVGPKLFKSFRFPRRLTVEIFLCDDILSCAPIEHYDFLLNSANESLVGTRQPYFPVGGPVPPDPIGSTFSSSRWGGMDAGENMMYPVQVLDGEVHSIAGHDLLNFLQSLPEVSKEVQRPIRCPVGSAVRSPSFGLSGYFGSIIHTVSPFYKDADWERNLLMSYLNSFHLAWGTGNINRVHSSSNKISRSTDVGATSSADSAQRATSVASVLLGSGCRAIPIADAARIAAQACGDYSNYLQSFASRDDDQPPYRQCGSTEKLLHFCLRETDHCEMLSEELSSRVAVRQKAEACNSSVVDRQ
jgi:O-acetyl-ADP-ribose deacetylase (regulator of RNase III)